MEMEDFESSNLNKSSGDLLTMFDLSRKALLGLVWFERISPKFPFLG